MHLADNFLADESDAESEISEAETTVGEDADAGLHEDLFHHISLIRDLEAKILEVEANNNQLKIEVTAK